MIAIDRAIRRAAVSDILTFHTDRPFRMGDKIRAWDDGVHIDVCCLDIKNLIGIARQRVFRTLDQNGIPNEVVEIDPNVTVLDSCLFSAENEEEQGRVRAGRLLRLTFPYTEEAAGWFEGEDGKIRTILGVVR